MAQATRIFENIGDDLIQGNAGQHGGGNGYRHRMAHSLRLRRITGMDQA